MKKFVFFDIDLVLADSRAIYKQYGTEPPIGTESFKLWLVNITKKENIVNLPLVEQSKVILETLLRDKTNQIEYLTARNESLRDYTIEWLKNNNLPLLSLNMRPIGNLQEYGEFKRDVIIRKCAPFSIIIIVDDDPNGSLEHICKEQGWLLIKIDIGD